MSMASEWVASNDLAFAIRDKYPVTPNHTLVITKRIVATWFEATWDERVALIELVDEVKRLLDHGAPKPDGYNLGTRATSPTRAAACAT
jgi:diadenosine tetraphosphate (Ap4A) HIT family hydrolase